ncbi:IS3 family transposase [Devosia sp. L53-10-65]|uniref:IS3 family transposase n=1 Tax=Devosia marina TaxID=2683198 RepID=A0A7X3K2Q0_9HYPH|nr:IS3 family transposase [Devosia marina]
MARISASLSRRDFAFPEDRLLGPHPGRLDKEDRSRWRSSCRRAQNDEDLKHEAIRALAENFSVYWIRKVWRQPQREGFDVARCTAQTLMRQRGLQGVTCGKPVRTTIIDKALLARSTKRTVSSKHRCPTDSALRLHLCRHMS